MESGAALAVRVKVSVSFQMPSSYKAAIVGKLSKEELYLGLERKLYVCSYYSCATSVKVLVRSEWTLQLGGIMFVNFYIIVLVSHIKYTVPDSK